MTGEMLRQYRIEEKLNEAGTVFRARDTRLDRDVVVKFVQPEKLKRAFGLKHPNIIAVFDAGDDFVVTEYFPGKPLDKLFRRSGMPVDDALAIAVQIADALGAAQSVGIVDGDLQASNVLVNDAGVAKVGEFGDVFAFGTVLREMFGSEVPEDIDRIVRQCLEPKPQDRWQRMATVKVALEDIAAERKIAQEAQRGSGRPRRQSPFLWLALIIVAVAAGALIGSQTLTPGHPTFQRLTYRRGDISGARFSPDGTVLFNAQWSSDPNTIFSVRPGSGEARPLDLPGARILSISSTGEMAILLGSSATGISGTLARVPVFGGAPREVLENVNDADWSPDGANLAVVHTAGGRNRIEYPIGTVLNESDGRPQASLRISPKGDRLAFFEYDTAVGDFAVMVLDRNGQKKLLSRGWTATGGLAWSPRGDEIWFSGGKTGGEPMVRALKMDGTERTVLEAPGWITLKDITRNGQVLATISDSRVGILDVGPGTRAERDLSWFDASRIYDMSPDGQTILFIEMSYGKPRNTAVYLRKTDGSAAVRLGDCNRPALSPDGKWVACIVSDGAKTTLNLLPTGAGDTRTIDGGVHYERVEWFPDGQRILFKGSEPGRMSRTFVQAVSGGNARPISAEGVDASRVSPNQKYATVAGAGKLSLLPIDGGEMKAIAALDPGESVIRWSGDGRYVFLRKAEGPSALKISRVDVASGRKEDWRELKTPDPVGVQIRDLVMTPDGGTFAYSFQRDISTLYLAAGLR